MIIAAVIVGVCLVISELIKKSYHVKPRHALAQFSVQGQTEQSEIVSLTSTLFVDETPGQHREKMDVLYAMREERLKFQNDRMMALQKEAEAEIAKAKADGTFPTLVKRPE